MTLDKADTGTTVNITEIKGGKGIQKKMSQMGISEGDRISIIKAGLLGGPIIISYNNIQYVIGRGVAEKIHIK